MLSATLSPFTLLRLNLTSIDCFGTSEYRDISYQVDRGLERSQNFSTILPRSRRFSRDLTISRQFSRYLATSRQISPFLPRDFTTTIDDLSTRGVGRRENNNPRLTATLHWSAIEYRLSTIAMRMEQSKHQTRLTPTDHYWSTIVDRPAIQASDSMLNNSAAAAATVVN